MDGRVVDASVLAALLFGEPKAAEAEMLLQNQMLIAPSLLKYELTQVTVKKVAIHPQKKILIFEALSLINSLDIQWVEVEALEVAKLAIDEDITAYDASYLYVSRLLDVPLVTFDKKLGKKI